jgi:DNA-binding response OmpR family regulator
MRILIIEDEVKLGNSLKLALQQESYTVDCVHTGEEGCQKAFEEEYDLIILDLGLPDMDGTTVAAQIREDKIKTPILVLTARDALSDKVGVLNKGADDYLVKPFEFEELAARIAALIRRSHDTKDVIIEIDSLTINTNSHIVKRGKDEIRLSAREYALLEFLARHKDQVVSRAQIMDHVWGGEIDIFSNSIDVYIGYIREKIDKNYPKEKKLIHTIKGIGYRLGLIQSKS